MLIRPLGALTGRCASKSPDASQQGMVSPWCREANRARGVNPGGGDRMSTASEVVLAPCQVSCGPVAVVTRDDPVTTNPVAGMALGIS
jgi:hypothetical protein